METEQAVNNPPRTGDSEPPMESAVVYAGVPQDLVSAAREVADHCKQYLKREWKHTRAPKGYHVAWTTLWNSSSSSTSSTATTFYSVGGYQAWLAYFLTTYSARESRSYRRTKIAILEGFPENVKRLVALE